MGLQDGARAKALRGKPVFPARGTRPGVGSQAGGGGAGGRWLGPEVGKNIPARGESERGAPDAV